MKIYIHDIKTGENRKKFENIVQNIQKYLKKYNIHEINEFALNNFDCWKEEMKSDWLKKWFFGLSEAQNNSILSLKKLKMIIIINDYNW